MMGEGGHEHQGRGHGRWPYYSTRLLDQRGAKLNENTELMKIRSRVKNIDRMNLRFILLLHSTLVTVVQIKYALLPSLHHHHLDQVRKSAPL